MKSIIMNTCNSIQYVADKFTTFREGLIRANDSYTGSVIDWYCRKIFRGYRHTAVLLVDNKSNVRVTKKDINPLIFSEG